MTISTTIPTGAATRLFIRRFRSFLHGVGRVCFILLLAGSGFASDLTRAKGTIALDAYNNMVATADRSGLVQLYDVSAPDRPVLLSKITLPMELSGIALAGDSLLVSGQGGVEILDISNPKLPQVRSNVRLGADATVVKAAGNLGYTAFGATVVLFDVATGEILDQHSYSELDVNDVALSADHLYVLSADSDLSAGFELVKLPVGGRLGQPIASWNSGSSQRTGNGRMSIYAADDLIYVGSVVANAADQAKGLEVIQDLGTSFKVAGLPSPINAGTARPSGAGLLAFVGAANGEEKANWVGLLDLSDPTITDKVVQTMATTGPVYDLTLHGGYAYAAAGDAGLQVVKFASPNGVRKLPAIALNTGAVLESPEPGSLMRLTAEVETADQVRNVDFYVNGERVASDGNHPFEYRLFEADLDSAGSLMAYACVEDIDGNSSCTAPEELNSKASNTLKVVSVSPTAGGHTPHSTKLSVSARFSLPLDTTTVAPSAVTLVKLATAKSPSATVGVSGVSYQPASKSMTIQPASPLGTGTYRVELSSAIRSSSGSTMPASYSWTFEVVPATVTWTSAASGSWTVATNWSGGAVPAAGDNVVINNSPGVTVTLSSTSPEVENLTVGSGNLLTIAGGSLSVAGIGSIATLNFASGTLTSTGPVTVSGTFNWTGGYLSGTGGLTVAKGATATIVPSSYSNTGISAGTLTNAGTVKLAPPSDVAQWVLEKGALVNNLAGATWTVAANTPQTSDGTAVFNNSGAFIQSAATAITTNWATPIDGAGTITVSTGTLNLTGVLKTTITGVITVASGATLDYGQGGTLDGGTVAGTGTFNFTAATTLTGKYGFAGITRVESGAGAVTFNGATTFTTLDFASGVLTGTGALTVSGTFGWTGGYLSGTGGLTVAKGATATIVPSSYSNTGISAGTLTNAGTVKLAPPSDVAQWVLEKGAVVNNLAGATWTVSANTPQTSDGTAVFNNSGAFVQSATTAITTNWATPIDGAGTITVSTGTLNLTGVLKTTITGVITVATGATLDYGQGGTLEGGTVAGTGTFNFTAATTLTGKYGFAGITRVESGAGVVTFNGATTFTTLDFASGTLTGTGALTVSGTLNWTGGYLSGTGGLTVAKGATATIVPSSYSNTGISAGTLTNAGTVKLAPPSDVAQWVLEKSAVVNNLAGATWTVAANTPQTSDGTAVFNNSGAIVQSATTAITTNWATPIDGAGTITVSTGTLNLTGVLKTTITGVITVASGATLDYGQGGTLDGGTVAGTGTFNFTAATTLTGKYGFAGITRVESGAGAVTFNGATTFTTLDFASGTLTGTGALTVSGTFGWTGGYLSGTGGLTVAKGATATIVPSSYSNTGISAGTLNNAGTVKLAPPSDVAQWVLEKGAVVNNLAGATWTIAANTPQTSDGTAVFNNSGAFIQSAATAIATNWATPIDGAGTITVSTGTLNLTGVLKTTITGVITVATGATLDYGQGGTLDGGTVAGTGTFNFTAGATVAGKYGFAGITRVESGAGAVTFNGATTFTTLDFASGTLTGTGALTVTGTLSWTGGYLSGTGGLTVAKGATAAIVPSSYSNTGISAGTLNNAGTVKLAPPSDVAQWVLEKGAVVNNLARATWTVAANTPQTSDGTAVFNNSGAFIQSAATAIATNWATPIEGPGTITVSTGTLNLTGALKGTITGVITVDSGATLDYGQGGTLDGGAVDGTGTFNFTATATVAGAYSFSGSLEIESGSGTVTFEATATIANLKFLNGALSLTGSGDFDIGNLSLSPSSSITLKLGGRYLSVSAEVDLSGELTFEIGSGSNPIVGQVFQVLSFADGYSGAFGGIGLPALPSGEDWQTDLTSSALSFTVDASSGS